MPQRDKVSLGEKVFCVANIDGTYSAMDNVCVHRGGSLGQGVVLDGKVVCPWHGWMYDVRNGRCVFPGRGADIPSAVTQICSFDTVTDCPAARRRAWYHRASRDRRVRAASTRCSEPPCPSTRRPGSSGASAADRAGFQQLVGEVSLGRAGIVLGLECSRLARNNADWHQLLQICAHNDCLILDEDGLYDPTSFNDRLVLGMKGQLSEAELHFLRSRLRGGILAKARRGELRLQLPIGLAYDSRGLVTLDPDAGIRGALSHLFSTFASTGSAFAVVRAFRQTQLTFPGRHRSGPRAGELYWSSLSHDQVLKILHNPAYAGAYSYGRSRHTTDLDGHHHTLSKPVDDWTVLIVDHHPGYITWPQYQANQQVLAANAAARGENRKAGPPREGPALLQGLIICGICGRRMTVRYHSRNDGTIVPDYVCQNGGIRDAQPICQHLSGAPIVGCAQPPSPVCSSSRL